VSRLRTRRMTETDSSAPSEGRRLVDLTAAVAVTRQRVEELHGERRLEFFGGDEAAAAAAAEGRDAAGASRDAPDLVVHRAASAFHDDWLPRQQGERYTLPKAYRDESKLNDADYVRQHLFGADKDYWDSVDLHTATLTKFVIVRGLDVESAAVRFLELRKLVLQHNLSFSYYDPGVQNALKTGAFDCVPHMEPTCGRPVICMRPRLIDWEAHSVHDGKKAWFYAVMTCLTYTPTAQSHGIVICNSMKSASLFTMNSEFRAMLSQGINHALPVRVHRAFIANEPFIFGSIMWPILKNLLSKKIRERMVVVGKVYDAVLADLPAAAVPPEMGGTRAPDIATPEGLKALLQSYDYFGYVMQQQQQQQLQQQQLSREVEAAESGAVLAVTA
jgi:hypothetical protein